MVQSLVRVPDGEQTLYICTDRLVHRLEPIRLCELLHPPLDTRDSVRALVGETGVDLDEGCACSDAFVCLLSRRDSSNTDKGELAPRDAAHRDGFQD